MKRLFLLLLLQVFTSDIYCQVFLNGSFENNTVINCMINNMTNAVFNSMMSDVRGIGLEEKIDIFYDQDCPNYGYANAGRYYVSVEKNGIDSTKATILSLKLADTLQPNMPYSFCYYDRGIANIGLGPIEIGVSNTNFTFGTLVYVSPLIDTVWTLRTVTFNSPLTARYVTVRYGSSNGGAIVDNFGPCINLGISEEISTKNIFNIYPNPASDQINVKINNNRQFIFRIYNSLGQLMKQAILETNLATICTDDLANGIYSIELSVDNKIERQRFIVEKRSR